MKPFTSSIRLQFHKDFTLDDAVALVPYFERLGISHVYASPVLTARAGSMHGYDVVDPTRINPELGGEPALRRLIAALRERDMGFILDIVSNHMAVGGASNPWWLDLLEWGRRSPYANFFDIQWHSPDPLMEGQLLIPFLGSDYGSALKNGDLPLRFDGETGSFYVEHYEHRFPVSPPDYASILSIAVDNRLEALGERFGALAHDADAYGSAPALRQELANLAAEGGAFRALETVLKMYDSATPEGFERLHRLLERQHYRLASWRTAADDINWRRFFDINELGGLRVERGDVFEATHAKIFQLVEEGLVDGLRIDHVDGLANPRAYCRRLRRRVERLLPKRPAGTAVEHFPIYVEKILGNGEQLHKDWQVDGTTGYEFMNQVSLLQHDPRGYQQLSDLWVKMSGRTADFMEEVRAGRQFVLHGTLAGDFESVAQALLQVARADVMSRDFTLGSIRRALEALIVHYTVYRTYITPCGRREQDEPFFQQAVEGARASMNEGDLPVLDFLVKWLGGEPWRSLPVGRRRRALRHACVRFQQLSSPTAAKAMEDTAFYRSALLLSRNDVGFDPEVFSAPVEAFHEASQVRAEHFPRNLLTTATHDHKRGEDTRARLAVISERGTWYSALVNHWHAMASNLRGEYADGPAPSGGDEAMLYQALLGSWPLDLTADDQPGLQAYADRMWQWQQKALREAKLVSSWSAPNEAYEKACEQFLRNLLTAENALALRQSVVAAVQLLAPAGALNSLVQSLLRTTAPGIPDLYQGTEFWDFSLVDPDNRRPVDYQARSQALEQQGTVPELLGHWQDGRVKQGLIAAVLNARAKQSALFLEGEYLPLETGGEHAQRIIAFARHHEGRYAIVIAPRVCSDLLTEGELSISAEKWGDTYVRLPENLSSLEFRGLFATQAVTLSKDLRVSEALEAFPVNLYLQSDA